MPDGGEMSSDRVATLAPRSASYTLDVLLAIASRARLSPYRQNGRACPHGTILRPCPHQLAALLQRVAAATSLLGSDARLAIPYGSFAAE
jgi:hypothetical protein